MAECRYGTVVWDESAPPERIVTQVVPQLPTWSPNGYRLNINHTRVSIRYFPEGKGTPYIQPNHEVRPFIPSKGMHGSDGLAFVYPRNSRVMSPRDNTSVSLASIAANVLRPCALKRIGSPMSYLISLK